MEFNEHFICICNMTCSAISILRSVSNHLFSTSIYLLAAFSGISASDAHPLECPLKKDMCSSLGRIQTKILSFNDTTGRCTVSDDCTNMTCQLIVVRSGINVPFSLALSLDPCEIPYPVRLDVDSTLLGPVLNGIFSESRNISVVLFGVPAVVTINIKQERYRMTLAVSSVIFCVPLYDSNSFNLLSCVGGSSFCKFKN